MKDKATKQNDKQTGKVVTLENYHHTYSLQSTLFKKKLTVDVQIQHKQIHILTTGLSLPLLYCSHALHYQL